MSHQSEGRVSPPALKLSCRPGQGFGIIFTGAHTPMAPVSHWTVLLSQSPSVPSLSPHSPGEAGASGHRAFSTSLCVCKCVQASLPHFCVSTFIFDVVASDGCFLLHLRTASVNLMGQFDTGMPSLHFFTSLLVPASGPSLLLLYLLLSACQSRLL